MMNGPPPRRFEGCEPPLVEPPRTPSAGRVAGPAQLRVQQLVANSEALCVEPVAANHHDSEGKRGEEVLAHWLSLIPADRFVLQRIVGARALVAPLTGRHLYSWRRLEHAIGADHRAVQRWHADGIR